MAGNGLVEESYICKLLEGGSLDTLKEFTPLTVLWKI